MSSNNLNDIDRVKKIAILFSLISLILLMLIISVFTTISSKRNAVSLQTTKKELAIRGDIISADGVKMVNSKKVFKASIDTRFLNKDKKEVFIKLFSIYSNSSPTLIRKKINKSLKKPKHLVLSYNIDSRTAKNLKELSFKLRRLGVFVSRKINGVKTLRGMNVVESGEKRQYAYESLLTPIIGYVKKFEENGKTKVKGIKGLENRYDTLLNNSSDGILKGKRDVLSYISFNKNSIIKNREDGANLVLNIPLKLQKNIELTLDRFKEELKADEIIASVMESQTGKIITLASSNRFNPSHIKNEDVRQGHLNINAVEYRFEPGSILKPITIALALDKNLIKQNELFDAYNKDGKPNSKGEFPKGKYKLGKYTIHDDHKFTKHKLTLDEIFIFSSNIGTLQIAQRIKAKDFISGFHKFSVNQKTNIDLSQEKKGVLPSLRKLSTGEKSNKDNVYKATIAYGQGMTSTFMQMMKAYSVFNNEGYTSTPRIVSHIITQNSEKISLEDKDDLKVIQTSTANEIKRMLVKTVTDGTGRSSRIDGLEIGGKTGTAQIATKGKYIKKYISSFFGFVNGEKQKYTIGVTVINPNAKGAKSYQRYASQSAVPVFKNITKNLLKLGYLNPKTN